MLGFYADYYIDLGMGRRITQEEALEILEISEAAGLVHQFADSQDPGAICNCCPDCGGGLRVLKMIPNAAELAITNHFAQLPPVHSDLYRGNYRPQRAPGIPHL